jgi:hypothetical protein
MLAIADAALAEGWTRQALGVLADVDDPRTLRWNVALRTNHGWALFDSGRIEDAIAELELGKDAAVRWGTPQQVVWADEALDEARAGLDPPVAERRARGPEGLSRYGPTRMSFLFTNSSAASSPISREVPERFTPPNGRPGSSASTRFT